MRCVFCAHSETKVIDSRPTEEAAAIRRRRECLGCGRRFTTYEKADATPLMVVKKDGQREPFNVAKITTGLMKACEKRPVPAAVIHDTSAEVEAEIRGMWEEEVPSREIGELVMDRLRKIDEVAYVRFASVYRQFRDVNTFMSELQKLVVSRVEQERNSGESGDES